MVPAVPLSLRLWCRPSATISSPRSINTCFARRPSVLLAARSPVQSREVQPSLGRRRGLAPVNGFWVQLESSPWTQSLRSVHTLLAGCGRMELSAPTWSVERASEPQAPLAGCCPAQTVSAALRASCRSDCRSHCLSCPAVG